MTFQVNGLTTPNSQKKVSIVSPIDNKLTERNVLQFFIANSSPSIDGKFKEIDEFLKQIDSIKPSEIKEYLRGEIIEIYKLITEPDSFYICLDDQLKEKISTLFKSIE